MTNAEDAPVQGCKHSLHAVWGTDAACSTWCASGFCDPVLASFCAL